MRDIPGFAPELLKSKRAWARWMKRNCLWREGFNREPGQYPCIGFVWIDGHENAEHSYFYPDDIEMMRIGLVEASGGRLSSPECDRCFRNAQERAINADWKRSKRRRL